MPSVTGKKEVRFIERSNRVSAHKADRGNIGTAELPSQVAAIGPELGVGSDRAAADSERLERDAEEGFEWWKRSVFYQIFPRSFQCSDGDGEGDLPGIIARLDYLVWLGIDAVWLSPIHPSPFLDGGYDISDFTGVAPAFGTLDDFDRLLERLHARGIRLILDFVPNHTSDQHAWFQESRSSRANPKRDWYVWADPRPDGGPPNNWLSRFGGSAWEWDATTGQYYYHAFLKEQPDLNWRNRHVRQAMAQVLRFWIRRDVDGFRVDASAVLVEDDQLRDDPPNAEYHDGMPPPEKFRRVFTDDCPETLGYLTYLRQVIDELPDRVLVGEVQGATDRIARFYGDQQCPRFHLPLNFCRSTRRGMRARLRRSSRNISMCFRLGLGQTGCWAATTSRGLPVGLGPPSRGSPPCCC
jgi:alpha-glucosidase